MHNVTRLHVSPPADAASKIPGHDQAQAVVKVSELKFRWQENHAPVLNIATLTIQKGERLFISGPSGSGKSTLLNHLGGLVVPQKGRVSVLGHPLDALSGAERDRFRADHIGFIFQSFNLIPYLSVIENVTLPCRFSRQRRRTARQISPSLDAEAVRLLSQLGIGTPDLLKRRVTDLSVGQQQRVAAARALIGAPEIVIADEPTSSLDAAHRRAFIQLLFDECAQTRSTLVFVSHDTSLAPQFDRTIELTEVNRVGREVSERTGEDA